MTNNRSLHLQRTLRKSVSFEGIGVHSGQPIVLKILPALPNHGILFVRVDLPGAPSVPAHYQYVASTEMATYLKKGAAEVSTVEHLLAALYALQIHNAVIEINGPEVPILDGSSQVFYKTLQSIGTEMQLQPYQVVKIKKKIELRFSEKWVVIEPYPVFCVTSSIEWNHPKIGYQEFTYEEGLTNFEELASARTFGFLKDVELLRTKGLARGGSLENAVVLDDETILNPEGLRFSDEFVRHKVLDALGDFMLAGMNIQGSFRLHRSGHKIHHLILKEIFKDPSSFEIIGTPFSKDTKKNGVLFPLSSLAMEGSRS